MTKGTAVIIDKPIDRWHGKLGIYTGRVGGDYFVMLPQSYKDNDDTVVPCRVFQKKHLQEIMTIMVEDKEFEKAGYKRNSYVDGWTDEHKGLPKVRRSRKVRR